jgi:hypothetical protein
MSGLHVRDKVNKTGEKSLMTLLIVGDRYIDKV